MKGRVRLACGISAAFLAGIAGSEALCRSVAFRDQLGCVFGRGHLLAIVNRKGFYENDLNGRESATIGDLVIGENLRKASARERFKTADVDRQLFLFRSEFGDDKVFRRALSASSLSISSLRERVTDQLRSLQWLEKQFATNFSPNEIERHFYEQNRARFAQPIRFRASHLFLAAHQETPSEIIEEKRNATDALALRISKGEAFDQLVAETSEDEATKTQGGDLGFFSAWRMPPEFFSEVAKLTLHQISKPFRSHLGFHIAQLNEVRPATVLSFEEARPEIALAIANEKRALLADQLAKAVSHAQYLRPD